MGNCGSAPKTNEGEAPQPEREEVESKTQDAKVEDDSQSHTKTEEAPSASDDKSLGTLLTEEIKGAEEPKEEEAKPEEEKPKTEELKEDKKPE